MTFNGILNELSLKLFSNVMDIRIQKHKCDNLENQNQNKKNSLYYNNKTKQKKWNKNI